MSVIQTILVTILFLDGSMKEFDSYPLRYPIPVKHCLIEPIPIRESSVVKVRSRHYCLTKDDKYIKFDLPLKEFHS